MNSFQYPSYYIPVFMPVYTFHVDNGFRNAATQTTCAADATTQTSLVPTAPAVHVQLADAAAAP